jgi:hypothetical protein
VPAWSIGCPLRDRRSAFPSPTRLPCRRERNTGSTVTFNITDGGLGDNDMIANGAIADPGGAGVAASIPVPTLNPWMLPLLGTLLFLAGRGHLRKPL